MKTTKSDTSSLAGLADFFARGQRAQEAVDRIINAERRKAAGERRPKL